MHERAKIVVARRRDPTSRFDWNKLTAISTTVLASTALFALIFTYIQIRKAEDLSRIQHLDELVRQFDGSPMLQHRVALAKMRINPERHVLLQYDPEDGPTEFDNILNFFEYVGLLFKRGYLSSSDVWDAFGYWMFNFYADARPYIDHEQKKRPRNVQKFFGSDA